MAFFAGMAVARTADTMQPDDDPDDPPLALADAPRPSVRSRRVELIWRAAVVGAGVAGVAALLLVAYVATLFVVTPGLDDLRAAQVAKPSLLMSADGKPLTTFRRTQQQPVPLDRIAPTVTQALIATEDRRFHEHSGIDVRRTFGAMFHTLSGRTQGGSTITQQLARNLFPQEIGRARTIDRKLKELITALRIERVYSKREILESYLNTAPFLYNVVGIEMAARTYFDKSAAELDTLESATLVGMLKGTVYYNPVRYPERAQKRRNIVLAQMVKRDLLSQEQYRMLSAQPLQLQFKRPEEELGPAPHFAVQLRKWLIEWADENDYNLYGDGLVIESTIDSRLQEAATRAVARQALALQQVADVEWARPQASLSYSTESYASQRKKLEPFRFFWSSRPDLAGAFVRESPQYRQLREGGASDATAMHKLLHDAAFMARLRAEKTRLEAGFTAMDPDSGEIKAWVGSRDFERDQFDHVTQAQRQPGSTFKPLVYAAALEAGIGPERTYVDAPFEVALSDGTVWKPTDMNGYTGATMTLRDGLVHSKNTITAQVSQDVGVLNIVRLAEAAGIKQSKLQPVPSLALGTSPVTLLEMVNAYATIANVGEYRRPLLVRRIRDRNGQVIAEFAGEPQRAISRESARDLIDMMRGVVSRGTGTAVKTKFGIVADIAGKTGTTQNNTDGWFILLHPKLVAGAWVGFNDQRVTMRSDHWGQGGHNAILVVGDFFRDVLKAKLIDVKAKFPPPWRKPIVTSPPPQEEGWTERIENMIETDAYGNGAPLPESRSSEIVIERDGDGSVVIGDRPGVEAMRRSRAPPGVEDAMPPGVPRSP
jgi:penicillin-binding protein 1A